MIGPIIVCRKGGVGDCECQKRMARVAIQVPGVHGRAKVKQKMSNRFFLGYEKALGVES